MWWKNNKENLLTLSESMISIIWSFRYLLNTSTDTKQAFFMMSNSGSSLGAITYAMSALTSAWKKCKLQVTTNTHPYFLHHVIFYYIHSTISQCRNRNFILQWANLECTSYKAIQHYLLSIQNFIKTKKPLPKFKVRTQRQHENTKSVLSQAVSFLHTSVTLQSLREK